MFADNKRRWKPRATSGEFSICIEILQISHELSANANRELVLISMLRVISAENRPGRFQIFSQLAHGTEKGASDPQQIRRWSQQFSSVSDHLQQLEIAIDLDGLLESLANCKYAVAGLERIKRNWRL